MPRFAANLSLMFTEVPFLERFERAARAGFDAVEYLFPYRWPATELAALLEQFGLSQVLFNLAPGDWEAGERGLAALPGRERDFAASIEQALEYAERLGCRRLHVMAGCPGAEVDPAAAERTYVENLRRACAVVGERPITLLIEPLNTGDMPGYFLTGTREARRILQAVGSERLRLQYDVYHMQIMEGNLAATLETCLPAIGHVQIAGVPGRHEPDSGEINYPFLFTHLDALGYAGWIGCEYRPQAGTEAGLGWLVPYGIRPRSARRLL